MIFGVYIDFLRELGKLGFLVMGDAVEVFRDSGRFYVLGLYWGFDLSLSIEKKVKYGRFLRIMGWMRFFSYCLFLGFFGIFMMIS